MIREQGQFEVAKQEQIRQGEEAKAAASVARAQQRTRQESMKHDASLKPASDWVKDLRSAVRPMLTLTAFFYLLTVGLFVPKYIVETTFIGELAWMMVSWWFGGRMGDSAIKK